MSLERVKKLTVEIYASRNFDIETPANQEYCQVYETLTEQQAAHADAFAECLQNGCTPKMADMLASQTPPGCMTDSVFLAGHCSGNQFEKHPQMGDRLKAVAEAHGQNTTGKVYLGSLARFPGDPHAWVNGRGDVKKVCEERGWGCEGSVSTPVRDAGRRPARKAPPGSLAGRLHAAGLPLAGN